MIKIRQSGDGLWKWRLEGTTWEGGYPSESAAREAAEAALRGAPYKVAVVVVK